MKDGDNARQLEALRWLAEKCGADDAVVVEASEVPVDPRVRLKCMIPKCFSSGTCDHCPPQGYSLQEVKDLLSRYRKGVFFRVRIKSSVIAAKDITHNLSQGIFDEAGSVTNLGGYFLLVFTIVSRVQDEAREMGFKSPWGLASGNCRDVFCHFQLTCQKMMTDRGCRHPHLSAPSLESCGINALGMAAQVGWEVYPIGGSLMPSDVPHGTALGLVLI